MRSMVWSLSVVVAVLAACGGDDAAQNNNENNNENNGDPVCSNGILEAGEQCDDGAQNSDSAPDACRNDCRSAFCGDGVIDASELCDNDELGATSCFDLGLGYTGGVLSCGSDCTFNDSECTECGNHIREGAEACDGLDVGSANCSTETGFQEGIISCSADCTVDTSTCHTCGDGIVQVPSEECEGDDVGGQTCEDLGYVWGILRCNDCLYDTDGCHSDCGNGIAEAGEECDAADFAGSSCADFGFVSGSLRCSAGCLVSIEDCTRCGNGTADSEEECDGADHRGESCASLSGGTMTGALSCTGSCQLDTSGCVAPVSCGNNLREVGESCDGTDLPVTSCVAYRPDLFGGGSLTCQSNCLYDVSACDPIIPCGNGVVEATFGEQCDGQDLDGASCISRGHAGGQLLCTESCSFDESQCLPALSCGNGTREVGEACDSADLGGQSCLSLGYMGGTLGCTSQCALDRSQCDSCGDSVITGSDECDGPDLGGASCLTHGYYGGTLTCTSACAFDLSDCASYGRCGDGQINGGELCDASDHGAATCESMGFYGGSLTCNATCDGFNISNCSGQCGNNQIEGSEVCDGTNVGQQDCIAQGFSGGPLDCLPNCSDYDTSGCSFDGILYVNNMSASCPGTGQYATPYCSLDDALQAAVPGNIIEILDGVYASATPVVVNTPGIVLRGQGYDPMLVMFTSDGTAVIDVQADDVALQDLFVLLEGDAGITASAVSGLVLDRVTMGDAGASSAPTTRHGMTLSNVGTVVLRDVMLSQLNATSTVTGIWIDGATQLTLENVEIEDFLGAGAVAIELNGVGTITSTGLRVRGFRASGQLVGLRSTGSGPVSLIDTEMTELDGSPLGIGWVASVKPVIVDVADSMELRDATFINMGNDYTNTGNDHVQGVTVSNTPTVELANVLIHDVKYRNPHVNEIWGVHLSDVAVATLDGITVSYVRNFASNGRARMTSVRLTRVASGTAAGIEILDTTCLVGSSGYCHGIWLNDCGSFTIDGARIRDYEVRNTTSGAMIYVTNCTSSPGVSIQHVMIQDLVGTSSPISGIYLANSVGVRGDQITLANLTNDTGGLKAVYAATGVTNARFTSTIVSGVDGYGFYSDAANNSFDLGYSYTSVYQCTDGADFNTLASTGNLYQDPLFVDQAGGDFHLGTGSPCIDAGNPTTPLGDEPQPNGGCVNQGAYGGTAEAALTQ